MKKNLSAILLLSALATAAFAGDVIKRGAALSDAKPTPLATVLASPNDYAKMPVLFLVLSS